VDIDNKLNNYLKITGVYKQCVWTIENLKENRIKLYNTLAFRLCHMAVKTGLLKEETQEE
jgi:hypothetical protein